MLHIFSLLAIDKSCFRRTWYSELYLTRKLSYRVFAVTWLYVTCKSLFSQASINKHSYFIRFFFKKLTRKWCILFRRFIQSHRFRSMSNAKQLNVTSIQTFYPKPDLTKIIERKTFKFNSFYYYYLWLITGWVSLFYSVYGNNQAIFVLLRIQFIALKFEKYELNIVSNPTSIFEGILK